ncbi:glycoside hydrolase family protein [Chryseobacterium daeguense]|uniref:hypothetical protein n=1 Tax=Chryseobacterium daeguense TaxID=412438 RepID=UPI000413EC98|nr:hypothetical protein [Chryseobacterium daeguense]
MNYLIEILKKRAAKKEQRVVHLSDILPSNFVESVLTLGAPVINDDAYSLIQNALSGGYIDLYWDKAVSLSSTLFLESNTNIYVTANKGAVLRNGVNKPMFRNKHLVWGNHLAILDKNIHLDGGVWNGNSAGQTVKGTNEYGFVIIFCWYGVENITLKNHKMYTPKTYAQHACNVLNGHISDFVVDVGANPTVNMDGVHWDGGCKDCSIKRGVISTYDDGIGMNADDLYNISTAANFFPPEANAPISDIEIEDIQFINSLFGIRIFSGQSRVDNITIKNISGSTANYTILIDNYWQNPNSVDKPGAGNIGTVIIDNVTTTVPSTNPGYTINRGKINLSASIENLTATNISPTGTSVPLYFKLASAGGYTYVYGNISINGTPI